MLGLRRKLRIETERMSLRLPTHADYPRLERSAPRQPGVPDPLGAQLGARPPEPQGVHQPRLLGDPRAGQGTALPLFLFRRSDDLLIGAITLDNIRRGPSQAGTLGYWIGQPHARQGYMREAIGAVVHHAFTTMDLSRIEAACLPENGQPRRAGEIRLQVRRRRAKLPADQRPLAQPCALRKSSWGPARPHRYRVTGGPAALPLRKEVPPMIRSALAAAFVALALPAAAQERIPSHCHAFAADAGDRIPAPRQPDHAHRRRPYPAALRLPLDVPAR
jgi:[ribosomal protein S5]-alanine N-acetyltransferase